MGKRLQHIIYGVLLILSIAVGSYSDIIFTPDTDLNTKTEEVGLDIDMVSAADLFLEDTEDKLNVNVFFDDTSFVSNPMFTIVGSNSDVVNKAVSTHLKSLHLLDLPPPFYM